MERKINLATLESKLHEGNAIKSGIKIYESGNVEFELRENGEYLIAAEDKSGRRGGIIEFTRNGCDVKRFVCNCRASNSGEALCKHMVAAVLAIQGGIADSNIALGKSAIAETTVTENNTAKAVGSGSLDVFATPMMVALMEQAACNVLADALEVGQTSVGTDISIQHTAASPIGMKITAAAVIESVAGRSIKFAVSANDEGGEIGTGTHTRVIVDGEKFAEKATGRFPAE